MSWILTTALFSFPCSLKATRRLCDPHCLIVCVCVCKRERERENVCVHMLLFCGFLALNVNGLPYSKNNEVEQRKPLTGVAPHLFKGRG